MTNKQRSKNKTKKKVLFLSPLPPPEYGSAMSSEMCLDILKNSKEFKIKNIKLNYSKDMSNVGKINPDKIKGIFKVKKQIKNKLKEFNPDFVYFVPATSGLGLLRDYLFVKEIKKHNKKIIFHVRSRTIKTKKNDKIYKKMFSGEKAIVLGEQLIKDVSDYIPKKVIFVLPNAIKNEVSKKQFREIVKNREEKNKKKNSEFNILFLSNMDKTKGWPKLLQACKILNEKTHEKDKEKNKDIKFKAHFVGAFQSEKDKEEFNRFVKNNNLQDKVKYLGKKTGKEKNFFLQNSDVLVFPTEYKLEACPRVIIEGVMFGLPVIANGIASIPNIIQHNKTGFVLKHNTPKEIADYLEKLYKNKEQGIKIGKSGRQRFLEEFELNKYKDKFLWVL